MFLPRWPRVVIVALGMIPLLVIILPLTPALLKLVRTADGRLFILQLVEKVLDAIKDFIGGPDE